MPRRTNSFARALKEAEKRLEKAQAERAIASGAIIALDQEIPRLQMTIAALRDQVDLTGAAQPASVETRILKALAPPLNLGPEELAKWYTDRDLSNVGSLVPVRPATPEPTEDELLPDDFAVGKKE